MLTNPSRRSSSKPGKKELRQLSKKGEMSALKEEWQTAVNGMRTDSVQKEIPVVSNQESHSGQRAHSSSSTSSAPTQTDGRKPYIFRSPRGRNCRVTSGTLPCA